MIFFTADPHFFHKAVIDFCRRPFSNVDEMNEALINNWNKVVTPTDEVYLLGDVSFAGTVDTVSVLGQLNGNIYLIRGNHDRSMSATIKSRFAWIKDYYEFRLHSRKIVLMHYAMRVWNLSHFGSWHLHGHSHGTLKDNGDLSMDVGVDCNQYMPVSVDQLCEYMSDRIYIPVDHHDPRGAW